MSSSSPLAVIADIGEAPYTIESYPDKPSWLAARSRSIGASEMAAALGLSRWPDSTPLALWARKRGLAPPVEETRAMRRGVIMEPHVAEEYVRETGRRVEALPTPWTIYRSKARPWLTCTPDRFVYDLEGGPWAGCGRGVLELKTTTSRHADEWENGVPPEYAVQTAAQLAVTGCEWSSLAVLIVDDWEHRYFDSPRDDAMEQEMLAQAERFWRCVESGEEPPAVAADNPLMSRIHPREESPESVIALPGEAIEWDAQRCQAIAEIEKWGVAKDEAEARIKQAIGERAKGLLANSVSYSWREQLRKGYVVSESVSRVLRRHAPRGGK